MDLSRSKSCKIWRSPGNPRRANGPFPMHRSGMNAESSHAVPETLFKDAHPSPADRAPSSHVGSLRVERILVPFDFSTHAIRALQQALAIGDAFGAKIFLANIVPQPSCPRDLEELPLAPDTTATLQQRENLQVLKALTRGVRTEIEFLIGYGNVWQELVKLAEETKADLIVIATHGRGGLRRVLWGSITTRIVEHAPCPVLVVRPVTANLG